MKSHPPVFDQIKTLLGTPAYEAPGIAIYHGDCLELMSQLPSQSIDLTITSPPYNIGKEYEKVRPLEHYLDWCETWMKEIYRLTRFSGAFWLNLGYFEIPGKAKAIPIPYLLWNRSPFYLIQEVVWNYGAGVACQKMFSPRNEKFLWYVKDIDNYIFNLDNIRDPNVKYPNQKKNGKLKCNPLGKNPTDVWPFPKVTSGKNRSSKERTPHPAQFPINVIDRIVKGCSHENNLIFDPFMGSGSTIEVTMRNKRYAIGFEIEKQYIEYTATRIENYLEQKQCEEAQSTLAFSI